jgi:hypothetical protein
MLRATNNQVLPENGLHLSIAKQSLIVPNLAVKAI